MRWSPSAGTGNPETTDVMFPSMQMILMIFCVIGHNGQITNAGLMGLNRLLILNFLTLVLSVIHMTQKLS